MSGDIQLQSSKCRPEMCKISTKISSQRRLRLDDSLWSKNLAVEAIIHNWCFFIICCGICIGKYKNFIEFEISRVKLTEYATRRLGWFGNPQQRFTKDWSWAGQIGAYEESLKMNVQSYRTNLLRLLKDQTDNENFKLLRMSSVGRLIFADGC